MSPSTSSPASTPSCPSTGSTSSSGTTIATSARPSPPVTASPRRTARRWRPTPSSTGCGPPIPISRSNPARRAAPGSTSGILARTDRVWASDTVDAVERQPIQRWTSLLLPLELIGSHVGPPVAHTTGRAVDLGFRCLTALFAHAGIEWDISAASESERARLAAWIELYKELRPLLHGGEVVRADDEPPGLLVHGVVADDRAAALHAIVRLASAAEASPGPFRLPGLDESRDYRVHVRGEFFAPARGRPPGVVGRGRGRRVHRLRRGPRPGRTAAPGADAGTRFPSPRHGRAFWGVMRDVIRARWGELRLAPDGAPRPDAPFGRGPAGGAGAGEGDRWGGVGREPRAVRAGAHAGDRRRARRVGAAPRQAHAGSPSTSPTPSGRVPTTRPCAEPSAGRS